MMNVIKLHKTASTQLIDVLNKLMQETNVNVNQLSRNTGLSNTTIKRMCVDPNSNPTISSIEKIAEFFGVTPNQLIGREPLINNITGYHPNFSTWTDIPILTLKQTIEWPMNIEEIRESAHISYVKTDLDQKESIFATVVKDESLEPKFSEGTILIFDAEKEAKNKDYILLFTKGKELPQFRQVLIDGSDRYARTLNQNLAEGAPTLINRENNKILGVLVQAKTSFAS